MGYYARYLDWFFTTPFFLLDLCLLAGADVWSTFYVMLLNALCIAAGAFGALNPRVGWPCFIFGMVTFVMFNAQLFGSMLAKAGEMGDDVLCNLGRLGKVRCLVHLAQRSL